MNAPDIALDVFRTHRGLSRIFAALGSGLSELLAEVEQSARGVCTIGIVVPN